MELFEAMKRRKAGPNVFAYNVLIGGLWKEKRIRIAEEVCEGFGWLLISLLVGIVRLGRWIGLIV